MKLTSIPERLLASSLSLLLVSCSVTHHSVPGPTSARDLGRYVLTIERAPDGQVTHSWRSASDFDLTAYASLATAGSAQGRIVPVAFNRNCEEERDACEGMCLAGLKGRNWSHMSAGSRHEHCRRVCMQPYIDCCRLKEMAEGEAFEFHAIDDAVDWMKRNSDRLLVGTVVVIAGVAFVVAIGASGGGVLLLAPVVVLASSDVASDPQTVSVTP